MEQPMRPPSSARSASRSPIVSALPLPSIDKYTRTRRVSRQVQAEIERFRRNGQPAMIARYRRMNLN
jgi:hypothetical protein